MWFYINKVADVVDLAVAQGLAAEADGVFLFDFIDSYIIIFLVEDDWANLEKPKLHRFGVHIDCEFDFYGAGGTFFSDLQEDLEDF